MVMVSVFYIPNSSRQNGNSMLSPFLFCFFFKNGLSLKVKLRFSVSSFLHILSFNLQNGGKFFWKITVYVEEGF